MDNLDKKIKEYLSSGRKEGLGSRGVYPSEEELYLFLTDSLKGAELTRMLEHLKDDKEASLLVAKLRAVIAEGVERSAPDPPSGLVRRVKGLFKERHSATCPHCGKAITPFKKSAKPLLFWSVFWLCLSLGGFGLSFVFPRYFMQCLALAILAGFKWVLDRRSLRTHILIYKALEESGNSEHSHKDLHRLSSQL